ncbi:unnamed protein product [Microthlaspi erraticum]|uniref:Uncharacterized protein n=1 Tax=Microthlaspi erraticum TaxID=1685480 RepID=A0A6D2K4Q8_9BRAS|nr:unnamed protein product [Microthlaspi erraticum]
MREILFITSSLVIYITNFCSIFQRGKHPPLVSSFDHHQRLFDVSCIDPLSMPSSLTLQPTCAPFFSEVSILFCLGLLWIIINVSSCMNLLHHIFLRLTGS